MEYLKEYSQKTADEFLAALKKISQKEDTGNGTFEVIATTESVDRQGESILLKGWDIKNYMNNPVILWGHDYWSLPIGKATEVNIEGDKMVIKGIFASTEFAQEVRKLYDEGIVKTVSVGFIPLEKQGNVITKAELLELSFVPVPANPDALSLQKMQKVEAMLKTAVEPHETPMADKATEWDAGKAIQNLETWAKGDAEDIDFSKFEEGFAWYDEANEDKVGSYKLPHHDIMDGELKVVWRGVVAAMGALLGARGGVDIPEADMQGVYDHLAKHYAQFEETPPELKSYTQYELDTMFGVEKAIINVSIKDFLRLEGDVLALLSGFKAGLIADAVPLKVEKSGRVLSTKNRTTIQNAVEALQSVLELADSEKSVSEEELQGLIKCLQTTDKSIENMIVKAKAAWRK